MTDLLEALVVTVRESAERERPLYDRIAETAPDGQGWTVKDHVAHLAAWRREARDLLDAVRAGRPTRSIPDVDAQNAKFFDAHRDQPAEQVLAEAEESYTALLETLDGYPPELLLAKRPGSEAPLWYYVPGNGHEHVADHLAMLALERDDEAAADAAQLWSHSLGAALPGNAARADYNLGCYFARTDRPDEALPYVRRAVEADAALGEWAQKDPDLAGMRELIAT